MLRRNILLRGAASSNLVAPPYSGRWFNPPHVWTWVDLWFPAWVFCFGPGMISVAIYNYFMKPTYSPYQEQHYYEATPYTKEFIHKYKRLERWRIY